MSATEIAFFLAQAADANGVNPQDPRRFCVQDLFFDDPAAVATEAEEAEEVTA